jgi:hypothetical protein
MAQYPIPNPQFGIYNNNNFSPQPTGQTGLTIDDGKKYFLTFPNAQTTQTEFLNNIGVGGTATFEAPVTFNDIVTYNSNIKFNNNVEVTGTTTLDSTLLALTTSTFDGEITCGGNILMTPQVPATNSIIDFVNAGGEVQLYLDPTTTYDMVFQSSQAENVAGLSVINATSSFTFQCSTITAGVVGMKTLNPINMNNHALYGISSIYTGTTYTSPIMTVTTTGLNMQNYNITNTNSIQVGTASTGTYTTLVQGGSTFGINNNYPYGSAPQISLAVNSSTGLVGIVISQEAVSCSLLPITNTPSISAPAGEYVVTTTPPTSDNTTKIATTAWVNTAISSIPGGVSLAGNNVWTGVNNFNVNAGGTTVTYVYGMTPVWNITPQPGGGNGDCDLICNTGTGATNTAFQIYCVGANTTNTTIATLTPQMSLSNNGFPMQVKDGIGIPTGKTYAVNGVNILNNTNLLGNPTAITQPVGTNNTTLATTAFVLTNGPIYTSSTFTLSSSVSSTISMNPTTVSVQTSYIQQTGIVTFNSVPFTITNITNNSISLLYVNFNINPWSKYPPASLTSFISVLCTTNSTQYTSSVTWSSYSPCALILNYPTGAPTTAGTAFTINLASLGGFAG